MGGHSPGRPGLRPHIRLLRGSQPSIATTALLPGAGNSVFPGGAGLTSKPHRDQSTRSRLTWAVSPAAGIGLPDVTPGTGVTPGATTGPGECHVMNASSPERECQEAHVGDQSRIATSRLRNVEGYRTTWPFHPPISEIRISVKGHSSEQVDRSKARAGSAGPGQS